MKHLKKKVKYKQDEEKQEQKAVFSLFLGRYGGITCKVNGSRRCSHDLPQGGLETLHIDVFWIRVKGRYNSKFRGFTFITKLMKIKPLRKFSTITVIGIRHSSYIQIYMYM